MPCEIRAGVVASTQEARLDEKARGRATREGRNAPRSAEQIAFSSRPPVPSSLPWSAAACLGLPGAECTHELGVEDLRRSIDRSRPVTTCLRQRHLAARPDQIADRAAYGVGGMVTELTNQRTAELIQQAAKAGAPAGSGAQKVGDYYASFMDEAAIEAKGLRAAAARARPHRRDRGRRGARAGARRHAARRRGRAQRHQLLHRQPLRPLDRAGPRRPDPLRALPAAGRARTCPTATTTSTPRRAWPEHPRQVPGAHRAGAQARAASPTPDAKAARIFDLERRIARGALEPRGLGRTSRRPTTTGRGRSSTRAAPGPRLGRATSRRRGWPAQTGVRRLAAERGDRHLGAGGQPAARDLEGLPDLPRHRALRRACCPSAFGDERFAFHGTVLAGTPQRRDRWKRAVDATSTRARRRGGPALRRSKYFPPAAKARVEAMVQQHHGRLRPAHRRPRLDGAGDQGAGQGEAGRARRSASAIPTSGSTTPASRSCAATPSGNAQRAELFELPAQPAQARPARRPRRSGSMTPQTVNAVNLPVHERDELPGRHPAAAVLRPRRGRWPWTTARSAPSSATRSATASTTRARCSTPPGRLAELVDGRGPGALRGRRRRSSSKQYDAYQPFPDLAVNGKLTLGENIADVAGLAAAYDAYRLSLGGKPAPVVDGLHRRPAVLHQLRAELAGQDARARAAPADPQRRPRARTSTAPTPCATSTPGTTAFDVKPGQALYLDPEDRVRVW